MPPRYLLRGCYRSLSTTPLRGSRGQQPRGAAVSAAMVAPCAGDVLRAAVVVRKSVPCHLRGWFGGGLSRLEGRATHAPAHPAPLARGIANALPLLPSPPQGWRSRAAERAAASPPKPRAFEMGTPRIWSARETLGKTPGEVLGWLDVRGFGQSRFFLGVGGLEVDTRVLENSHLGGEDLGVSRRKYFWGGREFFETDIRMGGGWSEMPVEPHRCWL